MLSEWLIAASALLTSITFFVITFSFPVVTADPGGLALFPRIAAILTGISSSLFLLRLATKRPPIELVVNALRQLLFFFNGSGSAASEMRRSVFVFALSTAYPLAILKIGFSLASFAFSFVLVRVYGGRTLAALALSLCLAVGLNLFFGSLLGVVVPTGDWTDPLFAYLRIY